MVVSISLYRVGNRDVLDVSVESVKIVKPVYWENGALNEQQQTAIKSNPDNYRYLDYMLAVKNVSDNVNVSNLDIYPEFFGDTKNIIFWFDSTDEIEDNVRVHPNFTRKCGRRIIVYSKGLSDDELLKMAKNVNLKLNYSTSKGNSILSLLSYGTNSQVFEYKEKS